MTNNPNIAALIALVLLALPFPAAVAQDAAQGKEYTGPNKLVSFKLPQAPNWAGTAYRVTRLDTGGDRGYDKLMLHVDDFGQYLVIGVRLMPSAAVAQMDADGPKTVLKNLSEATLMGWRTDFGKLPEVERESYFDSTHGDALARIYRARKGSILLRAEGRQPTQDDAFDTNIASLVARRGNTVVFVIAENDSSPDDGDNLLGSATELFNGLRVKAAR